jgi:aryl-alcohol dehydrogenase-like predicted oxidoreductase
MSGTNSLTHSLNRRRLLGLAAGAGAVWTLSPSLRAAARELPLITKAIPSSGERLPVIGLGTIWYRDAQSDALRAVLKRLGELGGKLIDSAAAYGESEGVVGRAIKDLGTRDRLFLATKFNNGNTAGPGSGVPQGAAQPGMQIPGPPAGVTRPTPDGVGGQASFERSLARLQTDHLDLLQVHGLSGVDVLMPLMLQWKKAGRIRYVGVTTSSVQQHDELIAAMRQYPLDFVQVDYSLGNREAAQQVLPVALERKVAVLANLPLGRTALHQQAADRQLPPWAADYDIHSWAQYFLKYVVAHPAVTCAIPGTTNVQHLEDDLLAGRGRLPDAAARRRRAEVWARGTKA